jgi:hypothetical protein
VHWRLSELFSARGEEPEAERHMDQAHALYAALLEKHALAYADHGAEFYLAGGDDPARALDLARLNLANRPTLRAFEQAFEAANAAGDRAAAAEILAARRERRGARTFRGLSPRDRHESEGQDAVSP